MAALRHVAKRILLAGQALRSICRAAITEEQRHLPPAVIQGRSSAYPRRFSSNQRGESDPDKERVVRVICRTAKAVSTIVVCGFVIKVCLDELSRTGDPLREARGMVKEYQDVMQVLWGISPEKGANSALQEEARIAAMRAAKEAWIEALRAKLKSIQEDAERGGGAGGGESA